MIRHLGLAGALLVASAAPSLAADPVFVEWRGAAILTAVGVGCGTDYAVGNSIPIRYRPSGFADNGANSKFAFHQTFFAQAFIYNGRFPNTWTTVTGGALGAGFGTFATAPEFRMVSILPANYTPTTVSLAFVGQIKNFEDVAGCNVNFRASAALKP